MAVVDADHTGGGEMVGVMDLVLGAGRQVVHAVDGDFARDVVGRWVVDV